MDATPGIIKYLKGIPLFKSLTDGECMEMVRAMTHEEIDAKKTVCVECAPGDALYLIESGKVQVQKKVAKGVARELAQLGPGSVFGEIALLDAQPCSATILALEPVALYRIDRRAFGLLRSNLHPAAYKVIRYLAETLCKRLREINKRIEDFYSDPAKAIETLKKHQEIMMEIWRQKSAEAKPEEAAAAKPAQSGKPLRIELAPPPQYSPPDGGDRRAAIFGFLEKVPILRGLSRKEIQALEGVIVEKRFPAASVICKEGGVGDSFFIVGRGAVVVHKSTGGSETKHVATIHSGGTFGEVSLIDGKRRSATCAANTDTILFLLRKLDFDALFRANNPFAFRITERIAHVLSHRVRATNDIFTEIFSRPQDTLKQLEQRVATNLPKIEETVEGEVSDAKLLEMVGYKQR